MDGLKVSNVMTKISSLNLRLSSRRISLKGGATTRRQTRWVAPARGPGLPVEVVAVWGLFAVVAIEILVTYSRVPVGELYHVSRGGFPGGASRVLVFLNFPLALVAVAILALLAERMPGRATKVAAGVGMILSAAIFWPGIVKQSDLDARPVNAIAALGVLVALSLTLVAAKRFGRPPRPTRQSGDRLRVVVAVAALALALPWIGADLGLFFNGVPVLGTLYQTGELRSQPHVPDLHPAVHHGHHHGMDGVLLVLSALLLSRVLTSVRADWLRRTLGAYLAVMLCYGAGNIANDFWLEQIVKRGWTDWEIPDVTTPTVSIAWCVILLAALGLWTAAMVGARRSSAQAISARPETA
jgi:hypothetical protein